MKPPEAKSLRAAEGLANYRESFIRCKLDELNSGKYKSYAKLCNTISFPVAGDDGVRFKRKQWTLRITKHQEKLLSKKELAKLIAHQLVHMEAYLSGRRKYDASTMTTLYECISWELDDE